MLDKTGLFWLRFSLKNGSAVSSETFHLRIFCKIFTLDSCQGN